MNRVHARTKGRLWFDVSTGHEVGTRPRPCQQLRKERTPKTTLLFELQYRFSFGGEHDMDVLRESGSSPSRDGCKEALRVTALQQLTPSQYNCRRK
ncbi:hypothetical protein E2C01_053843 [Portunus trituberculatus]|uniref:Uncharacterized protein n=1 Tax=Portunus trituberculatus TaxID=210409 RepID=A0A5B7GR52_PORTR|nr:hypothetical protein [Portunus trituberculatus]